MKRITIEEIEKLYNPGGSYSSLYGKIRDLIEKGKIKPVKASGVNGKRPALHCEYWLMETENDLLQKEKWKEELLYSIIPAISVDYYLKHLQSYKSDRDMVLLLNDFLKNNRKELEVPVSWNERSFAVWHREKFLQREQGIKILKRCGLCIEDLNVYETSEPLAYYVHTRKVPQNILIIENKDTFYSMRRVLLNGGDEILGLETGTLVYGAGKAILRSFQDFNFGTEPYMRAAENKIYYFGDLDYEGIGIYERLEEMFRPYCSIRPFTEAYDKMLQKAAAFSLPKTKDGQNRNLTGVFFEYFNENQKKNMREILEKGEYIPQEILCSIDF